MEYCLKSLEIMIDEDKHQIRHACLLLLIESIGRG